MVFPIVLGTGKRLFARAPRARCCGSSNTTPVGPDGVFVLTYKPAAKDASRTQATDHTQARNA